MRMLQLYSVRIAYDLWKTWLHKIRYLCPLNRVSVYVYRPFYSRSSVRYLLVNFVQVVPLCWAIHIIYIPQVGWSFCRHASVACSRSSWFSKHSVFCDSNLFIQIEISRLVFHPWYGIWKLNTEKIHEIWLEKISTEKKEVCSESALFSLNFCQVEVRWHFEIS